MDLQSGARLHWPVYLRKQVLEIPTLGLHSYAKTVLLGIWFIGSLETHVGRL